MASLTMMASFAAVAVAAPSRRGCFAVVRAAKADRCQQEPARLVAAEEAEARPAEGRRAVMLAAAAAAVAAIGGAGAAMADPKKGSPEAKKKYAPICVTMPAAKVDRCQQEPARLVAAEEAEARPAEGRRAVMLAAAAAAVAAIGGAGAAMADPKKGSPEAKKKYAPICVTMPTAKVCHN